MEQVIRFPDIAMDSIEMTGPSKEKSLMKPEPKCKFTKSQWEIIKDRRHSTNMDSLIKPVKQQKFTKNLSNDTLGYKSVSKMLLSIHRGVRERQNLNQRLYYYIKKVFINNL